MTLKVFAPGVAFGNSKRRVLAQFSYAGENYWLWVTDPVVEREYLLKSDGSYRLGECFATISLGEPFNDKVYKLVAALILPPRE
jgi:hypothetical protein